MKMLKYFRLIIRTSSVQNFLTHLVHWMENSKRSFWVAGNVIKSEGSWFTSHCSNVDSSLCIGEKLQQMTLFNQQHSKHSSLLNYFESGTGQH